MADVSAALLRSVAAHMVELQALAALLALKRARERVLGQARRVRPLPVVVAVGGITLGWIVGASGGRSS